MNRKYLMSIHLEICADSFKYAQDVLHRCVVGCEREGVVIMGMACMPEVIGSRLTWPCEERENAAPNSPFRKPAANIQLGSRQE